MSTTPRMSSAPRHKLLQPAVLAPGLLALGLFALGLLTGSPLRAESDQPRQRAEAAAADLGSTLKQALLARMQAEGPLGAIDFCQQQAPALAQQVAARHQVEIGRSALRIRNPDNAPTPWQQDWLQSMQTAVDGGQAVASQQREAIVAADGERQYRYARALTVEAPCTICHGQTVAEPILAALRQHYPADQATGYAEGDLRGLLWVSFPLPAAGD